MEFCINNVDTCFKYNSVCNTSFTIISTYVREVNCKINCLTFCFWIAFNGKWKPGYILQIHSGIIGIYNTDMGDCIMSNINRGNKDISLNDCSQCTMPCRSA